MNNIKLKSLLLKEQLEVADLHALESLSQNFVKSLIDAKVIQHYHKDLTAADVDSSQYIEDISEVVRNEVIKWVNMANARGGR